MVLVASRPRRRAGIPIRSSKSGVHPAAYLPMAASEVAPLTTASRHNTSSGPRR
jgi:hypothetical protein